MARCLRDQPVVLHKQEEREVATKEDSTCTCQRTATQMGLPGFKPSSPFQVEVMVVIGRIIQVQVNKSGAVCLQRSKQQGRYKHRRQCGRTTPADAAGNHSPEHLNMAAGSQAWATSEAGQQTQPAHSALVITARQYGTAQPAHAPRNGLQGPTARTDCVAVSF